MNIGTFIPYLCLLVALTGCLQKASTKTESLLSSFLIQAPKQDTSTPPDYDNVDAKGYVRFKGTCLNIVDSFQIQFVGDMDANGTVEYSSWFNLPSAAPSDTRTSAIQTAYPLNPASYDASCVSDGTYDFWILISQVDGWLSTHEGIDVINLRGMYGTLPTETLASHTNHNGNQPEANTFEFFGGHIPVGVGLCQQMGVGLAYLSGGVIQHNTKNSSIRTFTASLDSGFSIGTDIYIYDSQDCSGSPRSNLNFTMPVGVTYKSFSYKMNSSVTPRKKITLTTTSFGTSQSQFAEFESKYAGTAQKLLAQNKASLIDGDCQDFNLLAVDYNNVSSNTFSVSSVTITATLSDATNFEFRTSCDNGAAVSGNSTTVTFAHSVDHQKKIYVKAKAGVTLASQATITLTQDYAQFSPLPVLYINSPQLVHHLNLNRLDNLPYLFNHECYPLSVDMRDASNNPIASVGSHIGFKLLTSDNIAIFDENDYSCSGSEIAGTTITITSGYNGKLLFWTRRQSSVLTSPLASTSNAYIQIDNVQISPYVADQASNGQLMNLQINQSLLDILNRGRQEIMNWQFGSMGGPSGLGIVDALNFTNPLYSHSTTQLISDSPHYMRAALESTTTESAGTRLINRQTYNFDTFSDGSNGVRWYSYTGDSTLRNWNFSTSGQAGIIGAYAYITSLSQTRQEIIETFTNNGGYFSLLVSPSGQLMVEYSNGGTTSNHCVTSSGTIQVNKWNSIVLRFHQESTGTKCSIFVNGTLASTGTDYGLPAGPSQYFDINYSSTIPSWRFNGRVAEVFVDVDQTSNGASRFSNSVMQYLHTGYFQNRYPLVTSP